MSLTTKHRSEIYEKLVPILGEENAEAMMAEFPATEHDQLVTRDHLRAEMAQLRAELIGAEGALRGEIGGLEGALRTELIGVEGKLRAEIGGLEGTLRGEISGAEARIRSDLHAQSQELQSTMIRGLLAMAGITAASLVGGMGLAAAIS